MSGPPTIRVIYRYARRSGALQYKDMPWDASFKPPYPHSFSTLYGPQYSAMPAVKSTDPKWIPAALKREWKEDCKPARVLRHVQQFHVEMPTRVTAAHVAAFEAWLEFEQDESKHVYDTFSWPVPKGCPAGDPRAVVPVARGTRPPGDVDREEASRAWGEGISHAGTNDGSPSQCRAAMASTARMRDTQEEARVALAEAEGNNVIVEGKYYLVCFELQEEPDELFFTLMLATNVMRVLSVSSPVFVLQNKRAVLFEHVLQARYLSRKRKRAVLPYFFNFLFRGIRFTSGITFP